MRESGLRGLRNRCLQALALAAPGAETLRVALHRARGVRIGKGVFISQGVLLETSDPQLITIGDDAVIGVRVTVIAHMRERRDGVNIGRNAFVGPGSIVLPNVTIGEGAVVTAGSVVTRSVPPMTVVQGNPAVPVARCGIPLGKTTTMREFSRRLQPLAAAQPRAPQAGAAGKKEERDAAAGSARR